MLCYLPDSPTLPRFRCLFLYWVEIEKPRGQNTCSTASPSPTSLLVLPLASSISLRGWFSTVQSLIRCVSTVHDAPRRQGLFHSFFPQSPWLWCSSHTPLTIPFLTSSCLVSLNVCSLSYWCFIFPGSRTKTGKILLIVLCWHLFSANC